ncbi:aspartic peptidase domain-containing protein [Kockiozyma suomiensis]|uniref:aspartic peptidase domain-containing protein n=1 Tax=Kockiozyma suomiensis TaxID=1337062 RepID=UPI00334423E6
MKLEFAAALLLAVSSAAALPLETRDSVTAPAVLHLPLRARGSPAERLRKQVQQRKALRRRDTVAVELANSVDKGAYLASISLGTPAQNLTVLLDTGSSDLWVQSSDNKQCATVENYCTTTGTYDEDDSSTAKSLTSNENFSISYADQSYANGVYMKDTLTLGNAQVPNVTFGLAENSTSSLGVFGIGFAVNEASDKLYSNVPDLLVSEGIIQSKAYSLWLNSLNSDSGSILFGGIDTAKFTGKLQTIDLKPTYESIYAQFLVSVTGMTYNTSAGKTTALIDEDINVVLDSGTTYAVLPARTTASIVDAIGSGEYDDDYGLYILDCSYQDSSDSVVLSFNDGGANLSVPLTELVVPLEYNSEGSTLCALGIQAYSDDTSSSSSADITSETYILGDAFLRAGYFVYDLDNKQVSIAQAVYDTAKSNIIAINSTGVSGQGTGSSSSSDSSSSSSSSSSSGGMKITSASWISVGITAVASMLLL